MDLNREQALAWIPGQICCAYRYGGNGPIFYDCSGFALAFLRTGGHVLEDMRAIAIADKFRDKALPFHQSMPGCLVFYGNPISHVMVVFKRWPNGGIWLVGARGGGEHTVDYDTAYENGAAVLVVKGPYRENERVLTVDPW